ncbi:hypothetical protein BHE74_00054612 [Ensete ventricosum]|nr:hypothetical protein BHE74_00054612 [Ensete ventricosum]RZR96319.1 hypothetical protein BHM03_00025315 [Ensete ventricosum]
MESPQLHGDSSPDAVPRRSQRPRFPPLGNVDCLFAFLDPMEEQRRSSDGLLLLLIRVRDRAMNPSRTPKPLLSFVSKICWEKLLSLMTRKHVELLKREECKQKSLGLHGR